NGRISGRRRGGAEEVPPEHIASMQMGGGAASCGTVPQAQGTACESFPTHGGGLWFIRKEASRKLPNFLAAGLRWAEYERTPRRTGRTRGLLGAVRPAVGCGNLGNGGGSGMK